MDDKGQPEPVETNSPELELPAMVSKPAIEPTPEAVSGPPSKPEEPEPKSPGSTNSGQAKKAWYKRPIGWAMTHKKISLPLTVAIGLAIIFAVPWSRYQAAGLVLKQSVTIKVLDSTTGSPVSGATVSFGQVSTLTDGDGQATLRIKDGWRSLTVSKSYYDSSQVKVLVPILRQKSVPSVSLRANGRQVTIHVVNYISEQPVAGVNITVLESKTSSITDKDGKAVVVVPTNIDVQQATASLKGYNSFKFFIHPNLKNVDQTPSNISLVPAGKIYFLSNATGTLNVMSTNLDGSGTKVVLAGKGNEEADNTTLTVSPRGDFVALLTNRTTDTSPQLYMINGSTGATTEIDYGNADFTIHGWLGNYLIYDVSSNSPKTWIAGLNKLKSYNAASGQSVLLSQSSAVGDSSAAADESFDFVALSGDTVVYGKDWWIDYQLDGAPDLSSQRDTLNSIGADGTNSRTIAKYSSAGDTGVSYTAYSPVGIYILQWTGSINKYYDYQIGNVSPSSVTIKSSQFYKSYPSYYFSPNGQKTFWGEKRDGQNSLFIGDNSGANGKAVVSQSDYDAHGWFSDQYLLAAKDSTLYVMSPDGGTPQKVTNYQKTAGYSPHSGAGY